MNIGIDIDGVLADFCTSYAALLEKRGYKFPPFDDTYPAVYQWPRAAGVQRVDEDLAWKQIKTTDFWRTLRPLPETRGVLAALVVRRFAGDNIVFITARPGVMAKYHTEEWLKDNGFPSSTVIIADGAKEKGTLARGLHLEVFIDDKPENCIEVVKGTLGQCQVFLLDQPYNREPLPGFIQRVKSVAELLDVLNGAEWRQDAA